MTSSVNDTLSGATKAAERIVEIDQLYQSMRKLLQVWLASSEDPSAEMSKKMLAKMGDIQVAHTLLLKAEERFHALSDDGGSDDPTPDLDDIRAEIGGMLDRLRDAAGQSDVPQQPD
ncbi:hypothetical protein [Yoonia sp. 208BN28-4]|uniref:hypothetical protein n=1 Tax=Yoonia sp. 208BN28-4 TaxID=3126505 RepID=UPI0030A2122C